MVQKLPGPPSCSWKHFDQDIKPIDFTAGGWFAANPLTFTISWLLRTLACYFYKESIGYVLRSMADVILFDNFKIFDLLSWNFLFETGENFNLWKIKYKYCFRGKYKLEEKKRGYKVYMKLLITTFTSSDAGWYTCVSKNSFGQDEGTIRLYGKWSRIGIKRKGKVK